MKMPTLKNLNLIYPVDGGKASRPPVENENILERLSSKYKIFEYCKGCCDVVISQENIVLKTSVLVVKDILTTLKSNDSDFENVEVEYDDKI